MEKRKKQFRGIIKSLVVILIAVFITVAFTNGEDSFKSLYTKIQIFSTIVDRIHRDYVEKIDPETLIDYAIKGVVSQLDPHSSYFTIDQYEEWSKRYEGYTGIGITFDIIRDKITIISVVPGGPASRAGLLPGDRIIAIEGQPVIGIKRDQAPDRISGPEGTKVRLTIARNGCPKPLNFNIIRQQIHIESIPYVFMIRPGIGYIGIVRFSSTTGDELEKALQKLESMGMKHLILDLRNNGGGYFKAAIDVVDKFLPPGKKIVYTKGRTRESLREYYSTRKHTHPRLPVTCLINRISASASEIVAGALQDWDRALIVGETSFGKGLIQSQYRFRDGSALLLTTAKYYTPSGRPIQRPYENKTDFEYFAEIINDTLRSKWENNNKFKYYRTMILRRKIRGGGGIRPDIHFKSKHDGFAPAIAKMVNSHDRPFFTFIEKYMNNYKDLTKIDQNYFLRNYSPNSKVLKEFLRYVRRLGFKITNKEFVDNKKDIQFLLKQEIAERLWGSKVRFKVQMMRDQQLLESLLYLREAEKLLLSAYHIFPQPNTH